MTGGSFPGKTARETRTEEHEPLWEAGLSEGCRLSWARGATFTDTCNCQFKFRRDAEGPPSPNPTQHSRNVHRAGRESSQKHEISREGVATLDTHLGKEEDALLGVKSKNEQFAGNVGKVPHTEQVHLCCANQKAVGEGVALAGCQAPAWSLSVSR